MRSSPSPTQTSILAKIRFTRKVTFLSLQYAPRHSSALTQTSLILHT